MKIKTIRSPLLSEDLYTLQFRFEDFTDQEKFIFSKYGFIMVDIPPHQPFFHPSWGRRTTLGGERVGLNLLPLYTFYFREATALEKFESDSIDQIQAKLKRHLNELTDFDAERSYELTVTGEIQKINEGARKALDMDSSEYKEIIEKNREVFEKLAKL